MSTPIERAEAWLAANGFPIGGEEGTPRMFVAGPGGLVAYAAAERELEREEAEEPCLDDDDQPIICAKCKAPILVGEGGYITRLDGSYHSHACYGYVLAAELNHARSALRSVLDVPVSDEPGALVTGIATLVEQRDKARG